MRKRKAIPRTISQSALLLLLLLLVVFAARSGIPSPSALAGEDVLGDAVYMPIISGTSGSSLHMLTLSLSGNGQVTVDPDKSNYIDGESVTLTAIPDAGWIFSGWSGDLSGNANPAFLAMDDDKNVTATFAGANTTHTLTVNVSGNGKVTIEPEKNDYATGESVTLTAIPDAGLYFNGWSGDLSGNKNPINLLMDADKSVTADFTVAVEGIYFISPNGNDNNTGTSEAQAWATFDRALNGSNPGEQLKPGDTLVVMDGVYYQSIYPNWGIGGAQDHPITIRAQNDGKAIIDGQGERIPIELIASHIVIEGVVAQNSSKHVIRIRSDYNVFRRVSAYNADTDENGAVIGITGANNLFEDCVASGTGRKMIVAIGPDAEHNTIRRCFTDWREWDGRNWCNSGYPWGEGLEFYNASNNLMENSIAYGQTPRAGISIMSQNPGKANGNKILGSISILAGMENENKPMYWGPDPNNPPLTQVQPLFRPGPTECWAIQQFDQWPNLRIGIRVGEGGEVQNTLLQDIFSWGSAGSGLTTRHNPNVLFANNRVNRATIYNNGLDHRFDYYGGIGTDATQEDLSKLASIENSEIERIFVSSGNYTSLNGEGARLTNRYVDGVLTDNPLWPWPMEDRIQAELGYSVTDIITGIIFGDK